MKKFIKILGLFYGISYSIFAMTTLRAGEVEYKESMFWKDGKLLEGEYSLSNQRGESYFLFEKGKIQKFSYDSKEAEDLEVEGKWMKNPKYFKGEVSIQKIVEKDSKREKKELSLDGELESEPIFSFANSLLTKKETQAELPSFEKVSSWKIQNGEKELEEEISITVLQKEKKKNYSMFQIEKKESKQIFSSGKLVHTEQSSETRTEAKSVQ